jgi:thioester reductase-like protein
VNYNLSSASFGRSVAGVVSLIKFAIQRKANSALQFFSSISSAIQHKGAFIPEEILFALFVPSNTGYAQFEYLSERLLDYACAMLGVNASIVRIGRDAGPMSTVSGWDK